MNTHQKFLAFNGKNIICLNVDGTYWIALRPILEALKMDADSSIKTTKNDPFLGGCTSIQTVQVGKNGKNQGRKMTCIPEKYIYGWLCFLRSDNKELNKYKETCYNLLYDHFHGTITNRKDLLLERRTIDTEMFEIKESLKNANEKYKKLEILQAKRKSVTNQLNSIDKNLLNQTSMFVSTK